MDTDTKWILGLSAALAGLMSTGAVLDYRDEVRAKQQQVRGDVFSRGSSDRDALWIQRQGKLGGRGYTGWSTRERQASLRAAVKQFGYRSTLSSILAMERSRGLSSDVRGTLAVDRRWLVQAYGGEGAVHKQTSKRKVA